LMAVVLLFAVGLVAVILTPFTLGLALLAFYLFFIYTLPAVIIGGRGAGEALGESARIAAKNFLSTLAVIVLLAIAFIVAAWLTRFFNWLPLLGAIIRQVITQAVAAYATLVIVGEYMKLRSSIDMVGVGVPPTASPPPSA
ncbi:MAG TPA: hypothetical protein VFA29_11015, partial [Candidatus Baltobacteraceae bacterium]|nr:hypothetical protein [Candidatus Baltobacteraceae bacterium]